MPAKILDTSNSLVRDQLVADLMVYEAPRSGEFDVLDLRKFVDDAVDAHDPGKLYTELPVIELPLVLILARINLSEARAARLSHEFSVSALGASSDKSSPLGFLLSHIKSLRESYEDRASALGVGLGGDLATIQMGEMSRSDLVTDRTVPTDTQPAPNKVTLSKYREPTAGTAWLRWTESDSFDFFSYTIYRGPSAGLEDLTTLSATDAPNPGVIDAATKIATITDRWKTYYKDSGLLSGTFFYVVVVSDESKKIAVSNELPVVVP